MKVVRDLAFPDADEFMVNEVQFDGTYQITHLKRAMTYVTKHRTALDGGAHIGTWSRVMAKHFARVVAMEPSPDTFECLEFNLTKARCLNVERHHAALGSAPGFVSMTLDEANAQRANTGARYAVSGGEIPVITIDSLELPDLDFLKLDIEGSEPFALAGAVDTLQRCRPIILFESKFLWTRHFGLPKDAPQRFLTGLGFHQIDKIQRDEIWGPR